MNIYFFFVVQLNKKNLKVMKIKYLLIHLFFAYYNEDQPFILIFIQIYFSIHFIKQKHHLFSFQLNFFMIPKIHIYDA